MHNQSYVLANVKSIVFILSFITRLCFQCYLMKKNNLARMIYLRCAERLAVLSGFCGATAGRITAGTRYAGSSTTGSASFTERGISYDKAGGMLAIQRYGQNASTPEDNLTLTYNGMTLASVTGTIGGQSVNATFTYDACGRTLTDGVSKLNYQYNLLGALTAVADAGTLTPTTLSTYRHLADGTKYMTVSAGNNGALLYRGPLTFTIADVTATTPAISFLRAETGSTGAAIIASATGSGATPYFYVTDQLGSVRAVVDSQGSVVERNDYYTYGKRHTTGRTYADLKNSPLLFSGKEDQGQALDIASGATTPSDLRILDFGARHYDPIVPRWTSMDPMAEKYYSISSYAYCAGDPGNLVDKKGMFIGKYYSYNGDYVGFDGLPDNRVYLVNDDTINEYNKLDQRYVSFEINFMVLNENAEEVDGLIIITREEDDSGTKGQFEVVGEDGFFGFTLEPSGEPTVVANKNRPISTGLYNTEVRAEGDFAGDFAFRIYNDNVSIQRGILGHVGNTKKDSTGCILFGMSRRGSYLLNSKVAMSNFRAFFNNKDNIKLIIR